MIVVDASAAIDLLLGVGDAARLDERLLRSGETLHTPHVFDPEVLSAIRRYERGRYLAPDRAREVFDDFAAMRVRRYPHRPLAERIWQLRETVSIADACYVALAEALDAALVTSDAALGRARGHRARVEVYR